MKNQTCETDEPTTAAAVPEAPAAPAPEWFRLDVRYHPLTNQLNPPVPVSIQVLPEGAMVTLRLIAALPFAGVNLSVGQFPNGLVPGFDRIERILRQGLAKIQHELKDVLDEAFCPLYAANIPYLPPQIAGVLPPSDEEVKRQQALAQLYRGV